MIVVMKAAAHQKDLDEVIAKIEALGYRAHVMFGVERNVIGCLGDERGKEKLHALETMSGVEQVMPILTPYKLAVRKPAGTEVQDSSVIRLSRGVNGGKLRDVSLPEGADEVDGPTIGGKRLLVIAGPCSVESEEQIVSTARFIKSCGAQALRGGAFKPRSSTYSFQGLAEEGLNLLQIAKQETGLPIVTELMDLATLDLVVDKADVIQIGARNMQNFSLLKALGDVGKPILLKRGMSATLEELLLSAEYILAAGNPEVILCERGIRTYETAYRNTLDLNAVPALLEKTHLPIMVDPSHGTGVWRYVTPLSLAAVGAGAHGLMIEVHPQPREAWSDGPQSLKFDKFAALMNAVRLVAQSVGKEL